MILFAFLAYVIPSVVLSFVYWKKEKSNQKISVYVFILVKNFFIMNFITLCVVFVANQFKNLLFTPQFSIKYAFLSFLVGFLVLLIEKKRDITFKKRKTPKKKRAIFYSILIFLAFFFSIVAILGSNWANDTFGLVTPEQILYHLMVPLEGTNTDFVYSFIEEVLTYAVVIGIIAVVLVENVLNIGIYRGKKRIYPLRPIARMRGLLVLVAFVLSFAYGGQVVKAKDYIKFFTSSSDFIEENYVSPDKVKITFPEKKRNLIYIYMESLESTVISKELGGQSDENLLHELTDLSKEGYHFSDTDKFGGAISFPGLGWTIAGMVGQTSGVPLKVPVDGNSYGEDDEPFLPGVTSLGELLEDQGYNQMLMVGSEAEFGGRKAYFQQHGNYDIFDYNTAKDRGLIPEDYKVWWGFEDSKLYSYAKDEIAKMSKKEEPFNFTMLTVNTHHIGGYLEPGAEAPYEKQYSNVYADASKQVVEFIRWAQQQDFYDDTTIIISGDHLSMDVGYFKGIDPAKDRRVFDLILNPKIRNKNTIRTSNRQFSTMDLFPTTLSSLDVKIEGNQLGLGTNLFSTIPTVVEKNTVETMTEELNQRSVFYDAKFLKFNSSGNTKKNSSK